MGFDTSKNGRNSLFAIFGSAEELTGALTKLRPETEEQDISQVQASESGLRGLGFPYHEAKRYDTLVKNGGLLLAVHASDEEKTSRIREVLKSCGARDISVVGEGSEFDDIGSNYQDESRRSGLNPYRMTDI